MFIIRHDFTSYNVEYNSDIKSITYHKIAYADLLAENSEIWKSPTNYFSLLPMCPLIMLLCYDSLLQAYTHQASLSLSIYDKRVIDNYPMIRILPLCPTHVLKTVIFVSKRRSNSEPCKATLRRIILAE